MATVRFLTGGDVAPDRANGAGLFGEIAARFRAADASFFNLEGHLSARGAPVRGKAICFRGAPPGIDGLAEAGISCVNLANNHMLDFGDDALLDTMSALDARRIGRFGAGRDLDEAARGFILDSQGIRVGFIGYTSTLPAGYAATAASPGVNPLQAYTAYRPAANPLEYPGVAPNIVTWMDAVHLETLRESVAAVRKRADVAIVYMHWGASLSAHVHDFQREIAHTAIEAGAHAVFGGHNHVLSAIEFHRGCPIVYCSGNLLFDHRIAFFTDETLKTFLFGATIDEDGLHDCYLLPVATGVGEPPRLLARREARWKEIADQVQSLSRNFGARFDVQEDAVGVRPGL